MKTVLALSHETLLAARLWLGRCPPKRGELPEKHMHADATDGLNTSLAEWMAQKKFKLYIYHQNGLPKKFKVHELRK